MQVDYIECRTNEKTRAGSLSKLTSTRSVV